MARAASVATDRLQKLLQSPDGFAASLVTIATSAGVQLPAIVAANILDWYIAPEISEKAAGAKYPAIHVYCEKATNSQTEKFRTFSGQVELAIEVRVSHDHVDQLQANLHHYVDAVTNVLDRNKGSWGQGMYYAGGYRATFQPVKRGGRCYLQTAKIGLEIHISIQ